MRQLGINYYNKHLSISASTDKLEKAFIEISK